MQASKHLILPSKEWEVLQRLAIHGPLNADKLARSKKRLGALELPPSTVKKCIDDLLSLNLIKLVELRAPNQRRGREVPIYGVSPNGLSVLLASRENLERLPKIFDANRTLANRSEFWIFSPWYQRKLLDAWELIQQIPDDKIIERTLDYHYYLPLRMLVKSERRNVKRDDRWWIVKLMVTHNIGPYNLLLKALVQSALSETSPQLMFLAEREADLKGRISTLDETLRKKTGLPDWFQLLLRRAYSMGEGELYGDLIVIMRLERDQVKARAAIISNELRKLRSIRSAVLKGSCK